MITATGLGSGLDINALVSGLVASERAGSDLQLDRQSSRYTSKFSALGSLKGSLASFQSSLGSLDTLTNYSKNMASSSASTELSVTADSTAIANNYSVQVSQLAVSHSLASLAVADTDTTALGTGTLTIRRGTTDYVPGTDTYNSFALNADVGVANITIDGTNNTLTGIMAAINDANVGVNAAVVNDGGGFRLLLTSADTGEVSSLEITVADDDGTNDNLDGLSRFAFNLAATNLEQTVAAGDAAFTVNGLAVSSASNTVASAIPGVSLNLNQVSTAPITVSVEADFSTIEAGVAGFIAGYNQFVTTANTLSAYDVENNIPAALVGDFTLRSINGQVDSILRGAVAGLSSTLNNLAALGITTGSDGTLTLDSTALTAALVADPTEVAQLFAAIGVADDEDVSFSGATSDTTAGDYSVNITTLASAGVFTGSSALPNFGGGGTLVISAGNDNYTVEVNGVSSGELTLTAGTYTTGASLANEIQAQINGASALVDAGITVAVSYDSVSDSIAITSNTLGAESSVNILAAEAADIGLSAVSGTDGVNVAGSIAGITATGIGNVLTGAAGSGAQGLSLVIGGTTTGSRGNVNFTRGLSNQLDNLLGQILQADGPLESRLDSYEERLKDVTERRAALELKWTIVEARYATQFNALDGLLASLNTTSTYLETQFESLVKPNST